MTRRVLVALDNDEASVRAAAFVNDFFVGLDVEVLALNAAPVPVPWFPDVAYGAVTPFTHAVPYPVGAPTIEGDVGEMRDEQTEEGRRIIEHTGIEEDHAFVEIGDPAEVIITAAKERAVDLVVVGAGHRGWWARLLHGSVSDDVVHHAPCPVLVVP